jgi:hypothetical protein
MQYSGEVNDEWVNRIMDFESKQGSGQGQGLSNYGYNSPKGYKEVNGKFVKKGATPNNKGQYKEEDLYNGTGSYNSPKTKEEAVNRFKDEYLKDFEKYPIEARKRLADYAYNTGRSPEDLLLLADGKISLDQINSSQVFSDDWKKYGPEIEKKLSDPEFIGNLNNAKDKVYQTTRMQNGQTNPAYGNTWYDRVRMFDPYKVTYGSSDKLNTPDNAQMSPIGDRFSQDPIYNASSPQGPVVVNNQTIPQEAVQETAPGVVSNQTQPTISEVSPVYNGMGIFSDLYNAGQAQQEYEKNYLQEIAGPNEPYGPMYSTPEFNQRMLRGIPPMPVQVAQTAPVVADSTQTAIPVQPVIDQTVTDENCLPGDPNCEQLDNPLRNFANNEVVKFKKDPYEYRTNARGDIEARKKGSNKWMDLSKSEKVDYEQVKVNLANAMGRGDRIKGYQYGGNVNNDHTFPVHPITEEFTEIQTEKGETVFLPDGTIVEVKADKLHKNMDKDRVTDILPEGAYIFSRDPFMKMGPNSSFGGVKLSDMKVGKTVFEYKENEITSGPTDIMLSDVFKITKDSTPADISRNIKKKFEVRDMKDDFFVQRANDENKKQRVEYLEILKTFSEFKKPKSKREVPKAQFGMDTSMNMGLDNMFNQQANKTLNNIMGYNNNVLDPYSNVDNNIKSKYNISSANPLSFENGGSVPHAGIGDLVKLSPMYWLGDYIAKNQAERQNQKLARERQGIWGQKEKDLQKTGAMNMLTNVGTMASAMNVPDYKYNDLGTEFATTQEAANRAKLLNQANTYGLSQGMGSPASLARYSGSNQNLGNYMAQANANNAALMQNAAQQQAQSELATADALNRYRTAGTDAYNQVVNNKMQAMQAATTQGLGNVGRSATDYLSSMGDFRFDRGMDKMSYDQFLEGRKQAARDRWENLSTGVFSGIAELGMKFIPGGQFAGALGKSGGSSSGISYGPNFADFSNSQYMDPISARYNTNFISSAPSNIQSSLVSGGLTNRDNFYLNPLLRGQ